MHVKEHFKLKRLLYNVSLDVFFHFHIMPGNHCCLFVCLEYRVLKVVVVFDKAVWCAHPYRMAGISVVTSEASVYYKCITSAAHISTVNFKPPCWNPQPAGEQTPLDYYSNVNQLTDTAWRSALFFITGLFYYFFRYFNPLEILFWRLEVCPQRALINILPAVRLSLLFQWT